MMKEKLLTLFNTLRFRLMLVFIVICLIPFVFIETIIYRNIEERALNNINEQMINSLTLISDYTTTFLTDIQVDFQNIIFQEDFILALFDVRDLSRITTLQQLEVTEKLSSDFESFLENDRIDSVYLYNMDQDVFYDFSYLSPNLSQSSILETQWAQNYLKALKDHDNENPKDWLLTTSIPNTGQMETFYALSYFNRFISTSGQVTLLSVNVKTDQLREVINAVTLPDNAAIYITDKDGMILTCNDPDLVGNKIDSLYGSSPVNKSSIDMDGSKRFISAFASTPLDYQFIIDVPYTYIIESARESRALMYGLYFLIILIVLLMSMVIQRFLLQPINAIIAQMRHVEQGHFDVSLPDNRTDELGIIYNNFNDMTRNIHTLIEKNYVEVLQRKQSDLNYIQTQLNEHFLYNTLDAIYMLILDGDQKRAGDMLLSLSKFFRTTLNNGRPVITIGEISAMLEHYANIMLERNQGKYTISIQVDPSLKDVYALKFLFQPALENAIIHGVSSRKQGGKILVTIKDQGPAICFSVWDNGKGIEPERLHQLNDLFKELTLENQHDFYALNNILNQAKLFYKDHFTFKIESTLYEYTHFTAILPKVTELPKEGAPYHD